MKTLNEANNFHSYQGCNDKLKPAMQIKVRFVAADAIECHDLRGKSQPQQPDIWEV